MITDITATTAEAEGYTGEDGLLYCGKCHTPKEAYFSKETAQWLGHDRHPVSYTHLDVYKRQVTPFAFWYEGDPAGGCIRFLTETESERLMGLCLLYTSRCV